MSKYCRNCGKEMKESDKVCTNCGTKIENESNNTTVVVNNANTGSNGMAIAGFVCALLGINLIGLILSIIGINNAKKCDGKNKGLAIAGVIISALRLILSIVLIFIILFWSIYPSIKEEINDEWENISEYQEDFDYDYNSNSKNASYDKKLVHKKDGKVVVYFFRGEGCPHCQEAQAWFNKTKAQYGNKYIVQEYEVWYDEKNAEYMEDIAESRGEEERATGVPYIIIGDQSWIGFDEETYGPEMIEQIKKVYDEDI